jgi:hypothetical protein
MMQKHLSRRTVLRGLGATISLPFLDAMFPAFAAQALKTAARPTRMAFLYVPNGIVMDDWTPAGGLGATPLTDLPRISSGLASYKNDLLFLTGLTSDGGRAHGDGPGDHGRAGAAYLTGVHPKKTSGKDLRAGVSMDQIAAQQLGNATKYASLEIGCEEGIQGGNCDNGYSCAYSNSLSWRRLPPRIPRKSGLVRCSSDCSARLTTNAIPNGGNGSGRTTRASSMPCSTTRRASRPDSGAPTAARWTNTSSPSGISRSGSSRSSGQRPPRRRRRSALRP